MATWTYTGPYEVEQPELRRSWKPGQTRETFTGDVVPYPGYATDDDAAVPVAEAPQSSDAEQLPTSEETDEQPAPEAVQEGDAQ